MPPRSASAAVLPERSAASETSWYAGLRRRLDGRIALLTQLRLAPRRVLLVLGLLHLVWAGVPAVSAWAAGAVVAAAERAQPVVAAGGAALGFAAVVAIGVFALALVLGETLGHAENLASTHAARVIDGRIRQEIRVSLTTVATLDLAEDQQLMDDIELATVSGGARGIERSIGVGAYGQLGLMVRFVATVVTAAILVPLAWWLAVVVFGLTWISRALLRRQWLAVAESDGQVARGKRRTDYWSRLAAGEHAAKEVRIFGLGSWLVNRRRTEALSYLEPRWAERTRLLGRQGSIAAITLLGALIALGVPALYAASGAIGSAELVRYVVAGLGVLGFGGLGHQVFAVAHAQVSLQALDRVRARFSSAAKQESAGLAATTTGVDDPHGLAVRLEDVTFGYPGRQPVLHGLDLELARGEVVAIVGHNGVGKTTLVTLLAGLRRPQSGRTALPPPGEVAVLFQDFVRYPLTLRDNVTLAAQVPPDEAGVERALQLAGAGGLAVDLPRGLDTVLSKLYDGGVDLSGGQWQKVALARAIYAAQHGCTMLVMDEPTAHLDAGQEAAFYDQVVRTLAGTTILLISHRLSTVRSADRIVLLEDGRVVEQGDHAGLIAAGGRYATMFALQASRFAAGSGPDPDLEAVQAAAHDAGTVL